MIDLQLNRISHVAGLLKTCNFLAEIIRHAPTPGENVTNGLFTLPDMYTDSDPDLDIRPKNAYSNNQGSGSRSELESRFVQC